MNFFSKALLGALILLKGQLFAQVPVITDFNPKTGAIGTVVNISGTGFSPTAANNKVYFGALKANVMTATSSQLTVEVPAGTAYDRIKILVEALWGESKEAFDVMAPSVGCINFTSMGPGVLYPTGKWPDAAITSDFNNDRFLDFATFNRGDSTVSILLGNGNGTFQTKADIKTVAAPKFINAGDFNGDGNQDLFAILNKQVDSILLLSGNGNGTFTNNGYLLAEAHSTSGASHDLNADGKLDLIIINGGVVNTISVYLGNGDATFQAKVDYTMGNMPSAVTVSDFNGDNKKDLAISIYGVGGLSVLLGKGDGTFDPKVDYTTGQSPTSIVSSDFNGDGKQDLATSNSNSNANSISVLLGNGNGTFQAKADYPAGTRPNWLALGDMNGDGLEDLLTINDDSHNASILLGKEDGTFHPKIEFSAGSFTYPKWIVVGDFNGDGRQDFAHTQYSFVSVFLNNSGSNSFPTATVTGSTTICKGRSAQITVTLTGDPNWQFMYLDGTTPYSVNATSSPYIINVAPKADASYYIYNFKNSKNCAAGGTATGTVNIAVVNCTPTLTDFNPKSGPVGTSITITGTDFDPDINDNTVYFGSIKATITSASPTQLVATVPAGATIDRVSVLVKGFTAHGLVPFHVTSTSCTSPYLIAQPAYPIGTNVVSMEKADLNKDGISDLVVVNNDSISVLLVDESGHLQKRVNYSAIDYPKAMAIADVNGDNNLDLIVTSASTTSYSILLGNGNGTFQPKMNYPSLKVQDVVASDFNGDGKIDLVMTDANTSFSRVAVFLGNGDGTFQSKVNYTTGFLPSSLIAKDVNGDGKMDIVTGNLSGNNVSVLIGTGTGTFLAKVDYAVRENPAFLISEDLSGDGFPDLAVADNSDNTVSILLNAGDGTFLPKVDYPAGDGAGPLVAEDFDNDGTKDLAIGNYDDNSVSLFINNGDGTFQPKTDISSIKSPTAMISMDIDSDGFKDVLVGSYSEEVLLALKGKGNGTFINKTELSIPSNSYVSSLGDFNNDGITDLVFCISPSLGIMLGNANGTFQTITAITFTGGAKTITCGDFNGDGNFDLAIGYGQSGALAIMLGNGDGTFQNQINKGTAGNVAGIKTADFNLDGFWDLVFVEVNTGYSSLVWLGKGDGTFNVVHNTVGYYPIATSLADFNKDGFQDYAVAGSQNGVISVILGNGNGTFKPKTDLAIGPYDLITGDFNGDANPDVIVASNSKNLSIFFGNGNGTFQNKITYTATYAISSIKGADLNGDGKMDLVCTNYNTEYVSILISNGDGTFVKGFPDYYKGGGATFIGDFNRDGKHDLLFSTSGVLSILFNGSPQPSSAVLSGSQTIAPGAPADLSISFSGNNPWSVEINDGSSIQVIDNINSSPYTFSVSPGVTTTYTLSSVTDSKGCMGKGTVSGSATVTVSGVSNILNGSTNEREFTIYPNPSEGSATASIRLTTGSYEKSALVQIVDLANRIQQEEIVELTRDGEAQFHLSKGKKLASGMYLIILKTSSEVYMQKLVIE